MQPLVWRHARPVQAPTGANVEPRTAATGTSSTGRKHKYWQAGSEAPSAVRVLPSGSPLTPERRRTRRVPAPDGPRSLCGFFPGESLIALIALMESVEWSRGPAVAT